MASAYPQTPTHEHTLLSMLEAGRDVLRLEASALLQAADRLNQTFATAAQHILNCPGRVVLMGVGKSGHVARKIAATLASTGSPALFVHATEAAHGDLGMIQSGDCVIAISQSGETPELIDILPALRRLGINLIAITGEVSSRLAQAADVVIQSMVEQEACPHNLAPTASTTLVMALGDALAVSVLQARGFTPKDFAASHPGGALGRRLLTRVQDIMRTGAALPTVNAKASVADAILEITEKRMGMTIVLDDNQAVLGIFTDGDLRRVLEKPGTSLQHTLVAEVMTKNPASILPQRLATEAAHLMDQKRINQLLVLDEQQSLCGALNMHDLLAAKVL